MIKIIAEFDKLQVTRRKHRWELTSISGIVDVVDGCVVNLDKLCCIALSLLVSRPSRAVSSAIIVVIINYGDSSCLTVDILLHLMWIPCSSLACMIVILSDYVYLVAQGCVSPVQSPIRLVSPRPCIIRIVEVDDPLDFRLVKSVHWFRLAEEGGQIRPGLFFIFPGNGTGCVFKEPVAQVTGPIVCNFEHC